MNLIYALLIAHSPGIIGALFAGAERGEWYAALVKPTWTPPDALFGAVWLLLYTLIGFSLYLIWKSPATNERTVAFQWFAGHFFFNAVWSPIFFGSHQVGAALGVAIAMVVTLLFVFPSFWRLSRIAALLLVPYFLWILFALALNTSIFLLN
jgi:translocator protein